MNIFIIGIIHFGILLTFYWSVAIYKLWAILISCSLCVLMYSNVFCGQWSSSLNVNARFVHNHLYCLLLVWNTQSSLSMQHQLVKHGSCSASSNSLENMSKDNDSINQSINQSIRVFYIALIKLSYWTHYNLLNSPFNYFKRLTYPYKTLSTCQYWLYN